MKCVEVRKYLSEYIDGKLAGELNAQVEEHLLSCEVCSEDLSTMMAIKERLGKMEEVEVPKEFLSSIHRRIEEESGLKKIFNALFKPASVKIPLELAAGLTAVILIIVLLNLQPLFTPSGRPAYDRGRSVSEMERKRLERPEIIEKRVETDEASVFEEKRSEVKEAFPLSKEREKEEIALEEEDLKIKEPPAEPVSKSEKQSDKIIEIALVIGVASTDSAMQKTGDGEMEPEKIQATRDAPESMLQKPSVKKAPVTGGEAYVDESALMDLYVSARELIIESGGRVISSEVSERTGFPVSVHAEIPQKSYKSFYKVLNRIADVSGPLPDESFMEVEWIRMTIQFSPDD